MNQISNLSSENSSNLYRNRKHIRRQTDAFASESLDFLDGKNLGEVDIYRVSSDTRGKVRRIIEKRIAQEMAKSERYFGASNYSR